MKQLDLHPITYNEACTFINQNHRHHKQPQGHKFSIAAVSGGQIVGVVMVGRPVNRINDDGLTLEVTRLCTIGHKNTCSFLYAAAWKVAKNLGYRKLITYILEYEPGTSLAAAGWTYSHITKGGTWSCPSRARNDSHPTIKKKMFAIT